ncbi:MAG: hypothetical protein WC775_06470 [Patescibacteria group bacterium]|jgi:hypothetical protein
MKIFRVLRVRILGLAAVLFLAVTFQARGQTAVSIYDSTGHPITGANPFPISGSFSVTGGATEITQLIIKGYVQQLRDGTATETTLAQVLTALQQLKFTGENLKTVFSNSTIGATQSGTWNIGSITTLPAITGTVTANAGTGTMAVSIASMPTTTVTASDLDIRALASTTDSIEVKQGTAGNLKVDLSGTAANSTAIKVDGSAVTQPVSIASMPSTPVTGSVTATLSDSAISESIVQVTLTSADTEYSYTLPAGTVYFFVGESTETKDIRYAVVAGQTADGGAYQTIKAGKYKESPYVAGSKVGAKTLCLRDKVNAGTICNIEFWTK